MSTLDPKSFVTRALERIPSKGGSRHTGLRYNDLAPVFAMHFETHHSFDVELAHLVEAGDVVAMNLSWESREGNEAKTRSAVYERVEKLDPFLPGNPMLYLPAQIPKKFIGKVTRTRDNLALISAD